MNGEPVLTELPEMKLLGVYRFTPGMVEQATRPWWCSGGTPMSYRRQTAPGKSNGRKGGMWQIHSPYTYCAELGSSYDVIGLLEPDKGFMRWCGLRKIHLPSDDFIELLTACCFYPRQIEMLVKLGLEDAVKDFVGRGVRNADIIKWDAEKPRDFMKCTPKEAMAACSSREPLRVLRLYIRHRDTPLKMTIETAAWLAEATIGRGEENYAVRLLKRLGITAEKLTAYLEKNRVALQEGGRPGLRHPERGAAAIQGLSGRGGELRDGHGEPADPHAAGPCGKARPGDGGVERHTAPAPAGTGQGS